MALLVGVIFVVDASIGVYSWKISTYILAHACTSVASVTDSSVVRRLDDGFYACWFTTF